MSASTSSFKSTRSHVIKSGKRDEYLKNIQKSLWCGESVPHLPVEAVADLATELFSTSCGARKLAGLHLPEAVRESCKGRVSPCSLVLALLYLERLKAGGDAASDYLADVTPSELFIVSMLVANKFLQDEGDSNEVENWFWAELSGFEVDHINLLERDFLAAIQWEVFVSRTEFWRRLHHLHRAVCLRQGIRRGWFTYSETTALLDNLHLSAVVNALLQVSAVCLASYTAAVLTVIGSAIVSAHVQRCLLVVSTSTNITSPSGPSSIAPSIPESWLLSLPSTQEDESNLTSNYDLSWLSMPAWHTDDDLTTEPFANLTFQDSWSRVVSYTKPATVYSWEIMDTKKYLPLLRLQEKI